MRKEVQTTGREPVSRMETGRYRYCESGGRTIGASGDVQAALGQNGLLMHLCQGERLLTRTAGSLSEGGLGRIYLRLFSHAGCRLVPLTGPQAVFREWGCSDCCVKWNMEVHGLIASVELELAGSGIIDWRVATSILDPSVASIDCIFGLDIGLADAGALQLNEAYVCQYVDQHVEYKDPVGPILMHRQNLAQSGGKHPWLMVCCPSGATAFGTDAHEVFGNSYRLTNQPVFSDGRTLSSTIRQYEYTYATLQSDRHAISGGGTVTFQFRAVYKDDHPDISSATDLGMIDNQKDGTAEQAVTELQTVDRFTLLQAIPYPAEDYHEDVLQSLVPGKWSHVERKSGKLLSFFTGDATHVVTREKESLVDRAHGTILMGAEDLLWNSNTTATTVYMNGIFGSQLVSGNTSFNKFNSVSRESLGLNRTCGQRIFICLQGNWYQLLTPSIFIMDRDAVKWIYRGAGMPDITVDVSICHNNRDIEMGLESSAKLDQVLITNELVVGDNESNLDAVVSQNGSSGVWEVRHASSGSQPVPAFRLTLSSDSPFPVEAGPIGITTPANLLCLCSKSATCVKLQTSILADDIPGARHEENRLFWNHLTGCLKLSHPDVSIGRIDTILKWYAHNAAIHYLSPHGLEQYTGAAWGTRDACQGPFELLLANGHYAACKDVLRRVFSVQYWETGDWPQWFMLEEYSHIAQDHAHGDIILWPLHALALYLTRSGDIGFLEEEIDFRLREPVNQPADSPRTVYDHMAIAIDHMVKQFIADTHLISYGDGDWNDSLQPAQGSLRKRLVSSWTVALSAQVTFELARGLQTSRYQDTVEYLLGLRNKIEQDFRQYLLVDGTLCGFLLFDEEFKNPEPLIHPNDTRTGIDLRLIPINRAILASLFTPEEAEDHLHKIEKTLKYPDGVRLMTKPAPYSGGRETFFRRAESAANFGREIGLQYVHAHIRYAEALAMMGKAGALWDALQRVNPVGIQRMVAHAELRQSNMYFSSSDAAFNTRAEAAGNMQRLKTGQVMVKGGWRLYSSGPGIYTAVVIERLLGLRELPDCWEFDPVLPGTLDRLSVFWQINNRNVQITFRIAKNPQRVDAISVNGIEVSGSPVENPYRQAGIQVCKEALEGLLQSGQNEIVVTCPQFL